MLVVGGLLVVPTLTLMTTHLTSNRVVEEETSGIYAADAGIQDALWKLGNGVDPFESADSYPLSEDINGMTVTVDKQALEDNVYTLRSTSTLNGKTVAVITAQAIAGSDYHWLFEHAINCEGDVDTHKNDVIYGGILCGGGFDGDADVRTGDVEEYQDLDFPSADDLKDYYMSTIDPVADNYEDGTYTITAGTDKDNPHMIPPIYHNGTLTINGSGYGKLSGNIYLAGENTGQLWIAPGTTIDLNGHTIFSEYYNNCEGDAINFQPHCYIFGPGCIIGIGNLNYQPHLGTGDQLIGVDDSDTGATTTVQDRFALYKFEADATGEMGSFHVKCYLEDPETEAHIKVALYDDDGDSGAPGTLLRHVDYADNITIISSWNPINIEDYELVEDNWYWLAAISDYPVISKRTVSQTYNSKYKIQGFAGFTFPDHPTGLSEAQQTEQYMFQGFSYKQEFIFLMSVECQVNLQPGTSFYGSIAGDTNVNLQPHCTINLVDYGEGDLDFPSITGGGSGSGEGGDAPPLMNYNIQ